jgi:hypothetical protein
MKRQTAVLKKNRRCIFTIIYPIAASRQYAATKVVRQIANAARTILPGINFRGLDKIVRGYKVASCNKILLKKQHAATLYHIV